MRVCFLLLFFFSTVSAFARQPMPIDTFPGKKDIIPFTIKLPVVKFPSKDSTKNAAKPEAKNLLAFPFVVRSLETDWGFGGIVARFFKAQKKDTTIRTSDVNLLGLYTLRKQLILVLSSTIFFPKEDHIARFQASYSYYPENFWGLGNRTSHTANEGFSQKQFFINPQFLKRIRGNLYLGLTYAFHHTGTAVFKPGGLFAKGTITGRYGGEKSGGGAFFFFGYPKKTPNSAPWFFFGNE